MRLLDLPDQIFDLIFSYLSFDDVAKNRMVCKKFNEVGQNTLNHGFYKLLNCHSKHLKAIKSKLPRRESERRNHALSKTNDVLTCVETRLSMLSMTYMKYIANGSACFIPGKVIDECYRIINLLQSPAKQTDSKNLRAHEILQELRDISSMAIEHFDEKIVPDIKRARSESENVPMSMKTIYDLLISSPRSSSFDSLDHSLAFSHDVSTPFPQKEFRIVKNKPKLASLTRLYKKQSKIIKSQSKQISRLMKSMKNLKRRLDETEIKNREISESLKANSKPLVDPPAKKKATTATMVLKRCLDES